MIYDIDFVITWVDSSDTQWQKSFARYKGSATGSGDGVGREDVDVSSERYRDWGLLRYWFRGVEQFAPWVRNIYFVTCGHVPSWLNTNHPRLKVVRHDDYIPKDYLPLFNSNPIELLMHRIPGLSEHFVYFNDDFFLTRPVSADYFFHQGNPCEMAVAKNHHTMAGVMLGIIEHDMAIIKNEYNLFASIARHPRIWFLPTYRGFLKLTVKALLSHTILSLLDSHAPAPYLKSTFCEVWQRYGDRLTETMTHRFRTKDDVSHWLFRYWQIAKGCIEPRNLFDTTKIYYQVCRDIDDVERSVKSGRYSVVVLNDSDTYNAESVARVQKAFEELLPQKSSFEALKVIGNR